MAAIEVKNLVKYWKNNKAVDDISFQVDQGEVFGFLGPNGAGKTTTIKTLVGLTKPTSGSIKIAGYDAVLEARVVKQRIGVVPEKSNLYDELTVNDNLKFVSKLYHVPSSQRESRIKRLLGTFQLSEYRDMKFGKLSKGIKRRTVLAASLIHEPEILFLDEPTSGLDIMSARNLRQVISDLSDEGVTIFLTTHYIEEAGLLCDNIALLVKGKIIEMGSPETLRKRAQDTPKLEIQFSGFINRGDLKNIPAEDVSMSQGKLSITTSDIHGALSELIKITNDASIVDIQTVKPVLEDAFIKLTGVSLESMSTEKEGKK